MNFVKTVVIFLLLVGLVGSAGAQVVTNKTARLKTKVVLSEARSIGGAVMTSIGPSPEGTAVGNEVKDTGTSAGHEYELGWKFVGRNGDKDIYRFTFTFTHMTKSGYSSETTTAKEVLFDGKKTTVFEDQFHTVIIESPSEKDLKDIEARKQI
jgi:hypothetical protein